MTIVVRLNFRQKEVVDYLKSRDWNASAWEDELEFLELMHDSRSAETMVILDDLDDLRTVRSITDIWPILVLTEQSDQEVYKAYHYGADMCFPLPDEAGKIEWF